MKEREDQKNEDAMIARMKSVMSDTICASFNRGRDCETLCDRLDPDLLNDLSNAGVDLIVKAIKGV